MKQTILRVIFFPLTLIFILQPFLSHKDYLLDLVVKGNTSYATEMAAPEGMVTPQIRDQVITNLRAVGFLEDEIELIYESSIKERKQRLDVTIRIPRASFFLYNFGTETGSSYYYGHNYIMSEYLEG